MERGIPADALHVTPARLIGKHEWRIAVTPSRYFPGARVTAYFWRRAAEHGRPAGTWNRDEHWPTYNHNDGCYAGLPRTLVSLWEDHRHVLKHWLEHGTAPTEAEPVAQLSLFAGA